VLGAGVQTAGLTTRKWGHHGVKHVPSAVMARWYVHRSRAVVTLLWTLVR
jgi:hypothetical protein